MRSTRSPRSTLPEPCSGTSTGSCPLTARLRYNVQVITEINIMMMMMMMVVIVTTRNVVIVAVETAMKKAPLNNFQIMREMTL